MSGPDKHRSLGAAQAAAHALRKILSGHDERKSSDEGSHREPPIDLDPLDGWFEGISLQKGHCCLLLKPQIVLRDESDSVRTCVVAAVQAKLQSYAIMDDSNVEDPITSKIMSRYDFFSPRLGGATSNHFVEPSQRFLGSRHFRPPLRIMLEMVVYLSKCSSTSDVRATTSNGWFPRQLRPSTTTSSTG